MSRRRIARIVLAAWYLLAATSTIPVAAEHLASRLRRNGEAGFACARHACGCRNAEQCRLRCCCFPKKETSPPVATLTPLSLDQCSGGAERETLTRVVRLGPHLPPSPCATVIVALRPFLAPADLGATQPEPADPPDKVPLARSA
jgi:hypothetical protein